MARHSFSDFSSQHKNRRILPHHGRRHRLIWRQCRRVTPMILYRERAHHVHFHFWPFVCFSCGWFVGGEPPTRRAVLPVIHSRHQRRIWVTWSIKHCNSHREILPPIRYYLNIQLLTAGLFFLRLDLCRWSPYGWCVNANENLRERAHVGGNSAEWQIFAAINDWFMGIQQLLRIVVSYWEGECRIDFLMILPVCVGSVLWTAPYVLQSQQSTILIGGHKSAIILGGIALGGGCPS